MEVIENTINDELKPDFKFGQIGFNYGYKSNPEFTFDTKEEAIEQIKKIGSFSPKYIIVECYSVTGISTD